MSQFEGFLKALEPLKEIGSRGESVFEKIPGYKCAAYSGLVLRKPSDELPQGNRVRIPTPVRKEMTALFKTLKVTSSFSSTPKDVTKCALQEFTGESPHLLRSCLRMAMLYPDLMKYDA